MKARIILLTIWVFLSFSAWTSFAQNNRIISDEEILDIALANLNQFIEHINGSYKDFGFNQKEDMNNVQLGAPYEVVFLSSDFVTDSAFVEEKNYFIKENYAWEVPLIFKDKIRCFMKVFYINDSLRAIGGGGAFFCQFLDNCEKKYAVPKEGKRYLLLPEVIYMCEFIMLNDSNNSFKLYPINKNIEGYNDCTYDASYNKHNSIKDFFNTYKTKIYTSTIDKIESSYKFEIYPNPLNINSILKGFIPQSIVEANMKIYDCNGKVLFKNRIKDRGEIKIILNREIFLKSGIYLCKITLDREIISKKIMVTN
ncbi:MAG: hypothetical protein FD181_2520 [Prolixibacteraceae bacterium]|nr:MAG: hypothetical protein FD181_2520 [Prolixibacteraceae bacterium]